MKHEKNYLTYVHLLFSTDQDNTMENAIPIVFTQTYHRFCRWHMVRKYRDPLNQLYKDNDGLCDKLTSVINHPLNPAEFERAWSGMIEEFKLNESASHGKLV